MLSNETRAAITSLFETWERDNSAMAHAMNFCGPHPEAAFYEGISTVRDEFGDPDHIQRAFDLQDPLMDARVLRAIMNAPIVDPSWDYESRPDYPRRGFLTQEFFLDGHGQLRLESCIEWDNSHDKPSACRGWLLRRLVQEADRSHGRYSYLMETIDRGEQLYRPIPGVRFEEKPHSHVMQLLAHCLTLIRHDWQDSVEAARETINCLLDWLLWSFGHYTQDELPTPYWDLQGTYHNKLAQAFDFRMLWHPYDYLGELMENMGLMYSLSMAAANNLANELFAGAMSSSEYGFLQPGEDYRRFAFIDPECGSGRLLLAASNYTEEAIGLDTNDCLHAKAAIINLYLYAPHVLFPNPYLATEKDMERVDVWLCETARVKGLDIEEYLCGTEEALLTRHLLPIRYRKRRKHESLPDLSQWEEDLPALGTWEEEEIPTLDSWSDQGEAIALESWAEDALPLLGTAEATQFSLPSASEEVELPDLGSWEEPSCQLPEALSPRLLLPDGEL